MPFPRRLTAACSPRWCSRWPRLRRADQSPWQSFISVSPVFETADSTAAGLTFPAFPAGGTVRNFGGGTRAVSRSLRLHDYSF